MSVLTSNPVLRWVAPAAIAVAVLGGGAAVGALSAATETNLPPRSAAQLLVDLQTARLDGLSGTVVQRADLGLPALPGLGGQGSAELTALLAGTHTLRVWYAGPDQARVALLGTLAETDVIRNGQDLWVWNSRANSATHTVLPATDPSKSATLLPQPLPFTPQQIADAALAAIDPSTIVTTDGSARIAGRDAYELVLAPRDSTSLVSQIRLAIDATEHVPLRVQVLARDGGAPAIEVAFTQISFARPDPEQFRFNPPPGAQVTESSDSKKDGRSVPDKIVPPGKEPGKGGPDHPALPSRPVLIGKGWTTVLVARAPGAVPGGGLPDELAAVMEQLPRTSGAWGSGRLLTSRLFSVLLTDDGRVLVGAVSPDRLGQAAADPAARLGS